MKADRVLVYEHKGGKSPLYRGILIKGCIEKRILSSIMKNRSLPCAGGG